ncbi:MAG: hypothetical protein ACM32O_19045 [Clostridia bacterium]
MAKKRYYVSVQSGTIMENQGDASYELEIDATPEEKYVLDQLLQDKAVNDFESFVTVHIPAIPYHNDEANDDYDRCLQQIYRKIHELGTDETKRHIETMNIL